MVGLGSLSLVTSAAISVPLWLASGAVAPTAWWGPALFALMGAANLAGAVVSLPRWARTRTAQMESLAERATRLVEEQERDR
jgi:hypothetical protein